MPNNTYTNLDAVKRERFYNVALAEFATHGYHQASITKIVNTLGIAKGSVYQYFDNKNDLYRYLVTSSIEKLGAVKQLIDKNFDGDLRQWFINRCIAEIKFMKQFPQANELIIKTIHDRSSELSEIRAEIIDIENKAVNEVLKKSDFSETKGLQYIIRAVKEKYLAEVNPSRDDQAISSELVDIASILFVTD